MCIDHSTPWMEAQTLMEIKTQSFLKKNKYMNTIFGVPLHVMTKKGSHFESELFIELSNIVGFHRLRTTSYHPQCNRESTQNN